MSKIDSDRLTNNQIIKYAHKPCLVHHRKLIFIMNSPVAVACVFSIFFPRWYFPTIRRVIFGFLSEMTAKINNGNDSMIRHLFEWEDREWGKVVTSLSRWVHLEKFHRLQCGPCQCYAALAILISSWLTSASFEFF